MLVFTSIIANCRTRGMKSKRRPLDSTAYTRVRCLASSSLSGVFLLVLNRCSRYDPQSRRELRNRTTWLAITRKQRLTSASAEAMLGDYMEASPISHKPGQSSRRAHDTCSDGMHRRSAAKHSKHNEPPCSLCGCWCPDVTVATNFH